MSRTQTAPARPAQVAASMPNGTIFKGKTRSGALKACDWILLAPVPQKPGKPPKDATKLVLPGAGQPIDLRYDPETNYWCGHGKLPDEAAEGRYQLYRCLEEVWLLTVFEDELLADGEDAEGVEIAGTWGSENGGGTKPLDDDD